MNSLEKQTDLGGDSPIVSLINILDKYLRTMTNWLTQTTWETSIDWILNSKYVNENDLDVFFYSLIFASLEGVNLLCRRYFG